MMGWGLLLDPEGMARLIAGVHTHHCPLCETDFPCSDGPEDCDQLPELWCDSCRVKQEDQD